VRIATYNINGVNRRLSNLLSWLAHAKPDAVCLQELKAETGAFPVEALEAAGYGAVWQGQKTWNGVAILARGGAPVLTRKGLPGKPSDLQARYIEAAVNGVLIGGLYAPNGNPRPGPKFDYKLAWLDRLINHAAGLLTAGLPVVLAGDFNIIPTEADIYSGHREQENALLQPESRAAFQRLLDQGWIDAVRTCHPNAPMWTFWGYLRHRWPNDKGMRLDHLLASPALATRLKDAGVSRETRGVEGASDHAPAWMELKPAASSRAARAPVRATSAPARARRRTSSCSQFGIPHGSS